jgi:AcrR family transcriptional regulator
VPRAALSEQDISAFRERICRAAFHLFASQGYDAVTLRGIAAEIGCSPMTPYRYFHDKDEIFALVRAEAFRRFAESQEAAIAGIEDRVEKLRMLGVAYVDFAMSDQEAYRLMFELHQDGEASYPELEAEGLRAWLPMRQAVAEAIEAGILSGDADTLAHVFWAGVHGLVSLELAGKLKLGRDLASLIGPMQQSMFIGNVTKEGLAAIPREQLAFGSPPRAARRAGGRRKT